jgi:4-carboxymuconolactone decarboxylase
MTSELYDKGMKIRTEVLGEAYVKKAMAGMDEFNRPLQELVTEYCWGAVWGRDGLKRSERSMINLAMISALNRPHELKAHIRGALNNGVTREQIREVHAEAADVAKALADGSRRLERLASDLRVVSTPASGTQELVEPSDALDAAWTVIRSRFTALPRFDVHVQPGPPIQSSHALVTQALLPVLERAVVMTGPDGWIRVDLEQIPGGVEFRLEDSGPGIPPDVIARIFDPFFTARPGTSAGGLGLAVAYGIAHGLGGDIAVLSPAGRGATFRVRLPRVPGSFVPPLTGALS